jgi:hypothetical protein
MGSKLCNIQIAIFLLKSHPAKVQKTFKNCRINSVILKVTRNIAQQISDMETLKNG